MISCDVIFRGGLYANTGNQDSWNYSSFQHTTLVGLQNHHVFTPFPIFAMDQPLALTKHTSDSARSTPLLHGPNMDRQQVRLHSMLSVRSYIDLCSKVKFDWNYFHDHKRSNIYIQYFL